MTETTTMTLVDFLGQRLDEDEAAARANAPVRYVGTNSTDLVRAEPEGRVLREVQAKRAIVALYVEVDASHDRDDASATQYMESAAMALAAAYSDHPDFREGWRP